MGKRPLKNIQLLVDDYLHLCFLCLIISELSRVIIYMGHPISSDNGLLSQKLLLKSECYYALHVAMGVAYSCLKYGVFITT